MRHHRVCIGIGSKAPARVQQQLLLDEAQRPLRGDKRNVMELAAAVRREGTGSRSACDGAGMRLGRQASQKAPTKMQRQRCMPPLTPHAACGSAQQKADATPMRIKCSALENLRARSFFICILRDLFKLSDILRILHAASGLCGSSSSGQALSLQCIRFSSRDFQLSRFGALVFQGAQFSARDQALVN